MLVVYFLRTPSRAPYRTPPACANRAAYPDPPPVVPHPESIDSQAAYRGRHSTIARLSPARIVHGCVRWSSHCHRLLPGTNVVVVKESRPPLPIKLARSLSHCLSQALLPKRLICEMPQPPNTLARSLARSCSLSPPLKALSPRRKKGLLPLFLPFLVISLPVFLGQTVTILQGGGGGKLRLCETD